jgi:hypothetical protein
MAKAHKKSKSEVPTGWTYHATKDEDYEVAIDETEKHSGTQCAILRSIVSAPTPFGNLMQYMSADEYKGKRLQMSAWVKTDIEEGTGQLWLRIDGDWKSSMKAGCFDNMDDRPIKGATKWKKYSLVVQVPEAATGIAFGLFLHGKGRVWLDDVSFDVVSQSVPLTGPYSKKKNGPTNLNFENEDD